jgi:hypothetical protein
VLGAALSQVTVHPTASPTLNDGGWVHNAALLLFVIGAILVLLVIFGYMRLAPRFQTDEGARRSVRAPRIQPGKEVRRPVNVTGAPMVVEPPAVAVAAPVPAAVAAAPAVAAPAPVAASAPAAVPAAPEGPAPVAVAAPAPVAAGAQGAATAEAATPATAPTPAPAPAPAAGAHKEVSLDQETFDRVLAELLDKGTERRVAEGQARRAAMIAARKKAEG